MGDRSTHGGLPYGNHGRSVARLSEAWSRKPSPGLVQSQPDLGDRANRHRVHNIAGLKVLVKVCTPAKSVFYMDGVSVVSVGQG